MVNRQILLGQSRQELRGVKSGLRFDRMEFSGSLGDIGTLIPLATGLIMVNGLNPTGIFFSVGLYYILSGLYFKISMPVQPMKVIGAYAIAAGLSPSQIMASVLIMGGFLLLIGLIPILGGLIRRIPKSVIRGVQLSTGVMLMSEGVRLALGTSRFQALSGAAEPFLSIQNIGPMPVGWLIGIIGALIVFTLVDHKRFPAAAVLLFGGMSFGLLFGDNLNLDGLALGFFFPEGPDLSAFRASDFIVALVSMALPQLPMTLTNAVVATEDLAGIYYGANARRVTARAICVSMGLANCLSFLLGGMPLCHGAGGLAAHYRFGARSAGSNLIIGTIFFGLALFLGFQAMKLFQLLPMAVLGVLLIFAGAELGRSILDIQDRKDLFVILSILAITLTTDLAAGFLVGLVLAILLRSRHFRV